MVCVFGSYDFSKTKSRFLTLELYVDTIKFYVIVLISMNFVSLPLVPISKRLKNTVSFS